jgi:uncharacterized protein (DUF924 family)
MNPCEPKDILHYWFGELSSPETFFQEREALWWGKDRGTDYFILQTFEPSLTAARLGKLESWRGEARSSLALILLMDQMSRSMYRGLDCAFENDLNCQILCLEGEEAGLDQELFPIERVFFYMPLMHAEDLEVQEKGVKLFSQLAENGPVALRSPLEQSRDFAVRHRDVIARFGRFPHRNKVLGRRSTTEEAEFLRQPGSHF